MLDTADDFWLCRDLADGACERRDAGRVETQAIEHRSCEPVRGGLGEILRVGGEDVGFARFELLGERAERVAALSRGHLCNDSGRCARRLGHASNYLGTLDRACHLREGVIVRWSAAWRP